MTSANGSVNRHFDSDAFPGRPRILFVGLGENSHTHSWIDLLEGARFNVRLFSMPTGVPPSDWQVKTYVTSYYSPRLDPHMRARLYPSNSLARFAKRQAARALGVPDLTTLAGNWLAKILRQWR